MSNSNEGAKCEVAKSTRMDSVIGSVQAVHDDVQSVRSKVHRLCERVGVQFDPQDPVPDAPPSYGSLPQLHEAVNEIGRLVADTNSAINKLEDFI